MIQRKLTLQHINQLIKYFAFKIQIRIDELEYNNRTFSLTNNEPTANEKQVDIINSYKGYVTQNALQVKLVRKFVQRIMQIFVFFKDKSKSQNLLLLFQAQIKNKLSQLLSVQSIDVEEVLNFIFELTKKGYMVKASLYRKRPSSRRFPSCLKTTKIPVSQVQQVNHQSIKLKTRMSYTVNDNNIENNICTIDNYIYTKDNSMCKKDNNMCKKDNNLYTKDNQLNTKDNELHKKGNELHTKGNQLCKIANQQRQQLIKKRPSTSKSYRVSDKKPQFIKSISQKKHNLSVRRNQSSLVKFTIVSYRPDLQSLYVDMNIDKRYVQRLNGKSQFALKQMKRRNQNILQKIKRQQKKYIGIKNNTNQTILSTLGQFNSQSKHNQQGSTYCRNKQVFGDTLSDLHIGNYRSSIRNMVCKSYAQKKKKLQIKLVSRKKTNIQICVENKQNIDEFKQII